MRRFLGFLFRLALLVALALWLADRPGTAKIVWHDYEIETSAAFLGLCALAVGFIFYIAFRFWHFLRHGPEKWRLHRKLKKMRHGQDHLTKGLVAVAGGNASEAGRLAVSARKFLGITASTQLLQAQAAQMAGDTDTAKEIFRALAAHQDSAVLGYRGLIMEARRQNDWVEVGQLVDKLHALKPKTPWLSLIRFELLALKKEWASASLALSEASSAGLIDAARAKQQSAALLIATSQNEAKLGNGEKALQAAEQAFKKAPGWLPAVINLVHKQVMAGHRRAALRTIEKNWQENPHPFLAKAYSAGHTNPIESFKQLERLCRDTKDHPVARLIMAEAALAADIWGEARRHLISLISKQNATHSTFRLLSRLEKRESGDEQAALQWLSKAVDAAPDPVWLCQSCGGSDDEWHALCEHCGKFNTLQWQSPGVSRSFTQTQPLLTNDWID